MTKYQGTTPKHKGILLLLALAVCLLPLLPVQAQASGENGTIWGSKGAANLRAYASVEARSLGLLSNGTRVNALWQQDGWYYVQAGSQKGFVAAFLVHMDGAEPPTPFLTAYVNTASRGNLNVRQSPSQDAQIAGVLPYGAQMTIYAQKDGWALISAGSLEGYVDSRHLSF
ncbi:MAG: SH3 domain-containing protein [Candidatus Limiplasma sp.]|nr:SH3 domain-containing protein [Candidatus Limiplasma sp.]